MLQTDMLLKHVFVVNSLGTERTTHFGRFFVDLTDVELHSVFVFEGFLTDRALAFFSGIVMHLADVLLEAFESGEGQTAL